MSTSTLDQPPQDLGYELLLYGHEQLLRGSDTAVLVAFAALAYQGLSGAHQPQQIVGFALLLTSVLLCAVVHFVVGNAYTHRGRRLLRGQQDPPRSRLGNASTWVAAAAGVTQLACVVVGAVLILLPEAPEFLKPYLGGA